MTSCVAPAPTCTDVVTGTNPGLHDGDVDVAGAGDNGRRTGRVGAMAGASHDHFRVLDRLLRRTDVNTNGARLALGGY